MKLLFGILSLASLLQTACAPRPTSSGVSDDAAAVKGPRLEVNISEIISPTCTIEGFHVYQASINIGESDKAMTSLAQGEEVKVSCRIDPKGEKKSLGMIVSVPIAKLDAALKANGKAKLFLKLVEVDAVGEEALVVDLDRAMIEGLSPEFLSGSESQMAVSSIMVPLAESFPSVRGEISFLK